MTAPVPSDTQAQVRVVGSNYTTFVWAGKPIAYLELVRDSGQAALSNGGPGFEFIHPLGYRTPTDIVTSRALDGGTLDLMVRELWALEVWEHLAGLTGAQTIVDVFELLARTPQYVTCTKIITPPGTTKKRGKVFHRCVIVSIQDGDEVSIGALSVAKQIRVAYTHTTKLT
jgi:hypothetical protein